MTDLREADVIRRRVPVAMLSDKKNRKPNINKVAVQLVRADNAHPYIPGSTIKGALRTGILYHFIRKDPTRFRPYWEEISAVRGSLKEKGRKWNEIILRLEHEILHTLTADDAASEDAVTSALRGLSVSDAALVGCVAKAPTIVVQKIDATTLIKSGQEEGKARSHSSANASLRIAGCASPSQRTFPCSARRALTRCHPSSICCAPAPSTD